eukprot:2270899-Alexandrium_andersonii.AAC.1
MCIRDSPKDDCPLRAVDTNVSSGSLADTCSSSGRAQCSANLGSGQRPQLRSRVQADFAQL